VVAVTLQAARDVDEGVPFEDPARRVIEENVWRALRFGLDGELIEPGGDATHPAAQAWERLLTWTAPVRAEIGYDPDVPSQNGAQRQRAAIAAGATMQDIYAQTVRETRETYAREGSAA
jgi:carboxylate-amine ligase